MRILVTGRDGQLARSLAEIRPAPDLILAGRPDFDLLDPAAMELAIERIRPDVIVNAAAFTAVDMAEDDPETAMAVNGVAPGVIARAANRINARMIQVSTDYVFDGRLDRAYNEDDKTAPLGVYGHTKLAGECAVAAAGVDGAILRTSWLYSPFGRNFVTTMLRLTETRDEVAVVADQTGCPTSAFDLAQAIVRLVRTWEQSAPVTGMTLYHAAGSGTANWAELARALFAVSGRLTGKSATVRDITTADYPVRALRPCNSVMDSGRLASMLGWKMPDWQTSVAAVAARLLA